MSDTSEIIGRAREAYFEGRPDLRIAELIGLAARQAIKLAAALEDKRKLEELNEHLAAAAKVDPSALGRLISGGRVKYAEEVTVALRAERDAALKSLAEARSKALEEAAQWVEKRSVKTNGRASLREQLAAGLRALAAKEAPKNE